MRTAVICFGLLAAIGVAGCGKEFPMAEVTGKVTYKGKPIPEGTIMFVPQSGFAAAGTINPDGTYRLISGKPGDGAVIGRHKIAVIPPFQPQAGYPSFPKKYQDAETSGLVAEVGKDGPNTFDFELTDP